MPSPSLLYDDEAPRRRGGGLGRFALGLLVLGGALGGVAYWAVGTPHYALWRLQRAILNHDVAAFEAGFDTPAVVGQLVEEMLAQVQQEAQRGLGAPASTRPGDVWAAAGRQMALGLTGMVLEGLKPTVKALATQAVEQELKRSILGLPPPGASLDPPPGGPAAGEVAPGRGEPPGGVAPGPGAVGQGVQGAVAEAPTFALESVTVAGRRAIARVVRREGQVRLGLVLQQQPDRGWRVVGLDAETLRALRPPLPPPR